MPVRPGSCHEASHAGHVAPRQAPGLSVGGVAEPCAHGSPQNLRPVGAARRLAPGWCSAGAGPTGGTNAFALHGARLPGPGTPPPQTPAGAQALRARFLWLCRGTGVRAGVRGRAGRDPGRAAEPRSVCRRRALCWPPEDSPALPACRLDRCAGDRGPGVRRAPASAGAGLTLEGLLRTGAGAGAGAALGRR